MLHRNRLQPYLILIFFFPVFGSSCKKDNSPAQNKNEICITVKDFATGQPVEGAYVSVAVKEDLTPQSGGTISDGYSDANGLACLSRGGFDYASSYSVEKPGYERYCFFFNPPTTVAAFEAYLLKRNGFIKFHLINQPPVFMNDSLRLLMNYQGNMCSGWGDIYILGGVVPDTIFNYPAIDGGNGISWNLYRNNALISDSSFSVTVLQGDTAFIQIDY